MQIGLTVFKNTNIQLYSWFYVILWQRCRFMNNNPSLVYFLLNWIVTDWNWFQPTWRKRWFALWTHTLVRTHSCWSCSEIRIITRISLETARLLANFRYTGTGCTHRSTITFIPCRLITTRSESTMAETRKNDSSTGCMCTIITLQEDTTTLYQKLARWPCSKHYNVNVMMFKF